MISSLTKDNWDKKTIELGGSILQSWNWGEFQASLKQKIHRFSGPEFLCLGIETELPMGKKYLYCPRGPVGNTEAALADLKKMESDRGLIFTRIEPAQTVKLPKAAKDTQPTHNWLLALEKTEEEILIGMKPKTRYNINLASRNGIIVKEGGQSDLVVFYQLLLETAVRDHFRLYPQAYYFQMWDHLAPVNLKLILVYHKEKLLAGMFLTMFGDTAIYMHGASSSSLRHLNPTYLMQWAGIRLAKQAGLKFYDFGGIAPATDPAHAWAGLTRFKKGFGGFEVSFPGAFDLIYSPIWYNVYKNARKLKGILR